MAATGRYGSVTWTVEAARALPRSARHGGRHSGASGSRADPEHVSKFSANQARDEPRGARASGGSTACIGEYEGVFSTEHAISASHDSRVAITRSAAPGVAWRARHPDRHRRSCRAGSSQPASRERRRQRWSLGVGELAAPELPAAVGSMHLQLNVLRSWGERDHPQDRQRWAPPGWRRTRAPPRRT